MDRMTIGGQLLAPGDMPMKREKNACFFGAIGDHIKAIGHNGCT
jgi:hypothetical protein